MSSGSSENFANRVYQFLHSVSAHFTPLQEKDCVQGSQEIPSDFIITVELQVNPSKGEGPDGIPTWLLQEYAPLLAPLICTVFNSSIRESVLPMVWCSVVVVPISKCNPPKAVEKDLRLVSLTPVLARELEFFVCDWILGLAGQLLDESQFG